MALTERESVASLDLLVGLVEVTLGRIYEKIEEN